MATYTVQPGDTLGAIAKKFLGKSSAYMVIANASGIDDPNRISVGQELTIPDDQIVSNDGSPEPVNNLELIAASAGPGISPEQLLQILKTDDSERVDIYLAGLNDCFARYQINTPLRMAHFLAQVCHESNNFKAVSENLNYSAKALLALFGKYFKDVDVEDYARQPEKIANRIYANRMDNGDEASGEGWKYRGRGLMQLTGKDNYSKFSEGYGVDVVPEPDQVATDPELCVAVAGWYWDSRKLNQYADKDDVVTITKRINGGTIGLDERKANLENAKAVLGV